MRGIKAVTCYYPTCAECGRDEDDINSCSDGVTHLNTPEEARKWWTDIDLGSDDGRLLCWECHYAERAERERLDDLRNRFGDITCRGCGKEHPGEDCPHSEPLPATYAQPKRCDVILRNGKAIPIDDSVEETWLIVANTRRNK